MTSRDRKALESWVDRPGVPLRLIIRAWIILLSASGHSTESVGSRLGVSASTVLVWRNRFIQGGMSEIAEDKKIQRPRRSDDEIQKIIEATKTQFPDRARRWSIRNMAKLMGVSRSTIQRIWKRHHLKPFADARFKFKHDPRFYEKCKDISGLYIASPHVFAVALLAYQAEEPVPVDGANLMTPASKPESQAVAGDDSSISRVLRILNTRHRPFVVPNPELLDFLKWVDEQTPPQQFIHLIVPRRCVALYPHSFRWLKRHPRFQQHVIPKEISPRRFLTEWLENTERVTQSKNAFPHFTDLKNSLLEFADPHARAALAIKRVPVSKPFFWVRGDRNYLTDERQLELNLTQA